MRRRRRWGARRVLPAAACLAALVPATLPAAGASAADASGAAVDASRLAARQEAQAAPRVSVTYGRATIRDVLAGFSEMVGISIVPSAAAARTEVEGVSIEDEPWREALDAILSSHGLAWERLESGIVVVDRRSALRGRDSLRAETRILDLDFARADSVAAALRAVFGRRARVVPYGATNSVIVTAHPRVLASADSLAGAVDRPTPQVAIEARIIFVDRTDVNGLGIVYDLKDPSSATGFNDPVPVEGVAPGPDEGAGGRPPFAVDLGGPAVAGVANANDRIASAALQILASTVIGNFSLTTFIEALESHQLSDVQATPSLTVVDGHQARIQVGQRTPIRVLEPSAELEEARVNVQFVETGIILRVTPHVTSGQILLDLHAERSGIAEAPADLGFAFDTQEGTTRLLLDDGETGVIGGLTLTDVSRHETGIPLLMDLPLLGALFRTSRRTRRKQDLIILVTPRIVRPDDAGLPLRIPGGAPTDSPFATVPDTVGFP